MFYMPESPRWLVKVGQEAAATETLMRIRLPVHLREESKVNNEIWEIRDSLAKESGGGYIENLKQLFTRCRKAVLAGVGLQVL
jgi:hypothetical protein